MTAVETRADGRRRGRAAAVWAALREAMTGGARDFTTGSLPKAVLLLAIPMILEMAMESVFGVVDALFVGRLGPDSVAVVGVTESLLVVTFAIALGLSLSTSAMVARRVGEGDHDGAAVAAVQAIALGVVVSVPVAALGLVSADRLLVLMGAPKAVAALGHRYTAVMLGGSVTIFLLFLINAIFRGAGDPSLAMRSLWLANAVNILLNPCLIFGLGPFPELGVVGSAVGTTIGRGVGVCYQLRALRRSAGHLVVERRHLRLDPPVMLRLLRVSLGGIGQFLIATGSWLGLVLLMTPFGSAALAGYTIAVRIIVVAILPAWGMSNAAATLVGQNLGAGKPERAERAVWLAVLQHGVPYRRGRGLHPVRGAPRRALRARPAAARWGRTASVSSATATPSRLGHGDRANSTARATPPLRRGAEHLFTATGCSGATAGWTARLQAGPGAARRVRRHHDHLESVWPSVGVLLFRRGTWKTREV